MPIFKFTVSESPNNEGSILELRNQTAYNVVMPLKKLDGTKKYDILIPNGTAIENDPNRKNGKFVTGRTLEARKTNGDDNIIIKAYN